MDRGKTKLTNNNDEHNRMVGRPLLTKLEHEKRIAPVISQRNKRGIRRHAGYWSNTMRNILEDIVYFILH